MRHDIYTLPQITLVGGQSETIQWRVFDRDGEPYDASGISGRFAVVDYSHQAVTTPLLTANITFVNDSEMGVNNVAQITLSSSDTLALYGKYIYQITLKDSLGSAEIPNQGIMFIAHNIDQGYLS